VEPGQFFQVSLPLVGEAPISVSGVDTGYIEMTIRNVGKLTNKLFALKENDLFYIRGPYGNTFPLKEFSNRHLVISAGGSGVAPVRGLIDAIAKDTNIVSQLSLIFGFRKPSAIIFREDIDRWKKIFTTLVTVDESEEGWTGLTGVIPQHLKKVAITEKENCEIIIVGPPAMMRFTAIEWINLGFKETQLWLSFERHMSCGVGKCGHCKIDDVYVCLDGPVFRYDKARRLID
jgi:anaerobic sulfite reductase subunit B